MGMSIDKTIKNGVDLIDVFKEHFPSEKAIDTIGELVEIAKKYQKIEQAYSAYLETMNPETLADLVSTII